MSEAKSKANSAEARARSADRMRKQWQDPEWRAARLAGIKASAERGTYSKANADTMKREWAEPGKRKKRLEAMAEAMEVNRPMHRAIFCALKADPAFEEKREKRAKEFRDKNQLRLKVSAIMAARKRRGFDVPRHLWKEYQWLVKHKKLRAHEAGAALGLVRS